MLFSNIYNKLFVIANRFKLKTLISLFFFLLALVAILVFLKKAPKTANATWFDDAWQYRISIPITSVTNLSDFQVKVTINTSSLITANKMQSNCADIRFTNTNGQPLPYWIETGTNACNTSSTSVWVKVNDIPTTGTLLYLYYGNPSVADTQDGESVFTFFDDFSSGTINSSKWITLFTGSNIVDVVNGALRVVRAGGNASGNIQSVSSFGSQFVLEYAEAMVSMNVGQHMSLGIISASQADGNGYFPFLTRDGNVPINYFYRDYLRTPGTWTAGGTIGGSYSPNVFSKQKLVRNGTTVTFYTNGSQLFNRTSTGISTNNVYLISPRVWNESSAEVGDLRYDFIFVRKYTSIEPTIGSFGSEEKGTGPAAFWNFDEGYGTTIHNQTETNGENGLVAWYKFDEGTGSTAFDQTGNNNLVFGSGNSAPAWVSARIGLGVSFNGSGSYAYANDSSTLNSTSGTWGFWFKTNQTPSANGEALMSKAGNGTSRNGIHIYSYQGKIGLQIYDNTTATGLSNSYTTNDNNWHQVYLTYQSGGTSTLYVDGKKVGSNASTRPFSFAAGNPLRFARSSDPYWASFAGTIDNVKIYNRILSPSEIASEYNSLQGNMINFGSIGAGATWSTGAFPNTNQKPLGKSLNFNGTNQYITTPKISKLEGANDYTFSAWIKTSSSGQQGVVGQYDASGNHIISMYLNNGTPTFVTYEGGYSNVTANRTVNDNNWHHIVMTKSGTTGTIYIDGKSSGSGTVANVTNTEGIKIGVRENNSYYFNGQIDEVKIFTYSLSTSQVQKESNRSQGVALGVGTKTSDPRSNGLIAWYKFDESGGSTFYDSSGNSATGNFGIGTSAPSWTQGKFGKAVAFNGSSNIITAPMSGFPATTMTDITIEFWAKFNAITTSSVILALSDDNTNRLNIHLPYTGNNIYWDFGNISTTGRLATSYDPGWLNQWDHWVFTVQSGVGMKIYRNGVVIASNSTTSTFTKGTKTLQFGNLPGYNFTNGSLDNLKIYNRALTPAEISYDYSQGGPIIYYNFDEGSGSILYDQTTNAIKQFPISDPNLVSYWEFEEYDGTTVYDLKGSNNGNFLVGNSAPSWTTNSKFGRSSLSFNGSTTKLDIPNNNSLNFGAGDFTISTWVNRLTQTGKTQDIVSKTGTDNGGGYKIGIGNAGEVYCQTSNGTNIQSSSTATGMVTAGSGWHHLVITRSGSSCRVYVDNIDRTSTVGNHSTIVNSSIDLMIGGAGVGNPWGQIWSGYIDSVKIYNRFFSTADVSAEYNRTNFTDLGYIYGLPSTWSDGAQANSNQKPMGKSLSFNGSSKYIVVPDGGKTNFTSNFTLETWINPTTVTVSPNPEIISKSTSGNGYRMRLINGGYLMFNTYGTSDDTLQSNSSIPANQWSHIIMTYDGTTKKIYINGKLDSQEVTTGNLSIGDTAIYIGANNGSEFFSGKIDELKIFPYALSSTDILTEYNRSAAAVLGVGPLSNNPNLQIGTTSSLLAWYKMDENSGGALADSSGNNNTGLVRSTRITGKFGGGITTNGTNNYSYIPSSTNNNFVFNQNFAVSFWVKPRSNNANSSAMVEKWDNAGGGYPYVFRYMTTSNSALFARYDGTNNPTIIGTKVIDNSTWHHIVGVKNGNSLYLYIDNILQGTTPDTTSGTTTNSYPIYLGVRGGGSQYFSGSFDNLKIYNRALTPAEISTEYNQGKPIAYWRLDEKDSSIAREDIKSTSTLNLINNPSFETNTSGWTNTNSATITKSADYTYFGNSSAKITTTGTVDSFETNTWSTPLPNTIYTLSAWVYIPNKVGNPDIDRSLLIWETSTGANSTTISNIPQGVWTRVSTSVTTGASPARIDSRIYSYNSSTPVYYDGVQLEQGPTLSPYCDGTLIGSGNSWIGATHNSTSICHNTLDGTLGIGSSAPVWSIGRWGNALSFNGTNTLVSAGKISSLEGTNDYSFSAWVKTASSNPQGVVGQYDNPGNHIMSMFIDNGTPVFITYEGGYSNVSSTQTINDNQWHHLVMTKSGSTGTIYIDGKFSVSGNVANVTGTTKILIGSRENSYYYMNGSIDEVKIYPYALTQNQVLIDYNNNSSLRF